LEEKEVVWRLKSRATWLEKGDENTKFFQAYAKGNNLSNTIWCLKDIQGRDVNSFEGLSNLGSQYFKALFQDDRRVKLAEIVRLAIFSPFH
jgi:hypothetical protein